MTVKELFDFITDPTITDKNMESCLDKLSDVAASRGEEPTCEERLSEEVFKSAFIPQTLNEVLFYFTFWANAYSSSLLNASATNIPLKLDLPFFSVYL